MLLNTTGSLGGKTQEPSPAALEVLEVLESVGEMLALRMICGELLMDEAS